MSAVSEDRATALISMTTAEKQKYTTASHNYGLSLSALVRVALREYMEHHPIEMDGAND